MLFAGMDGPAMEVSLIDVTQVRPFHAYIVVTEEEDAHGHVRFLSHQEWPDLSFAVTSTISVAGTSAMACIVSNNTFTTMAATAGTAKANE